MPERLVTSRIRYWFNSLDGSNRLASVLCSSVLCSSVLCCRWLLVLLAVALVTGSSQAESPLRFNRDIRPILTDKCFACHGPDAETVEGGLRLDLREEATLSDAIVPGDPDDSELIRRIESDDLDEQMPPSETHKSIDASERTLLRRWIAEGAEYESHWAYTSMRQADPPAAFAEAHTNPIDQFIASHLSAAQIAAVPKADRVTLIRRLSLDLTGMPPTIDEVETFLNDTSENAYLHLVNRLLDSPRYGERMAIYWLDLVRYADTVGYHGDQEVSQSPYRDYVIDAFNTNMPYDQFIREQVAGDLLPDATLQQQVASGYNRLNQTTEEGGSQAKEYLAIYFADRVRNVSQVFMGATVGCAQCHDHKFDPYTIHDFYSLGAFFADLQEQGVYGARSRPPMIRVPDATTQQQLADLDERLQQLRDQIEPLSKQLVSQQSQWEIEARDQADREREIENVWVEDAQDTGGASEGVWNFITADQGPVYSGDNSRRQKSGDLVQHFFLGAKDKVAVTDETRFFSWVYLDPDDPPKAIMLQLNDGSWDHRAVWGSDDISYGRKKESWAGYHRAGELPETGKWVRLETPVTDVGLTNESSVAGMAFTQFGGTVYWDKSGWISGQGMPTDVLQAIAVAADERTEAQADAVTQYYLANALPMIELKQQITQLESERQSLEASSPLTVVSKSVSPREIRVLPRGNWMDDSGPVVQPAIPEFLGSLDLGDRRATRLDLANWLAQADNPLTARTMANRVWSLMFGRGICESVDDLGGQGTYPSYPELLDWLAIEFVQSGWDIKHLVRLIVTSDAYRRASNSTDQLRELDPYNAWFARQGRFRIDAELVRDTALHLSGLLVETGGGPSAKPYQPAGYYAQLNFPKREYQADRGDNQYRRGVYTHWQRTFLHPMLKAFDAPSREECTAARSRSNTPLQALVLLNDPTFVEAARVFAARIMHEGGSAVQERIRWAYRAALSREPDSEIATELESVFQQHHAHYREHVNDAKELISVGDADVDESLDASELAAWTGVARVVLNLHELMMRY